MNYQEKYNQLVEKGKSRELQGYSEVHHIVPRCMQGGDEESNLVRLTPQEHLTAHLLLMKIYPKNPKLISAALIMSAKRPGNTSFGWVREKQAKAQSLAARGRVWATNNVDSEKLVSPDAVPSGWRLGRLSKALKVERERLKAMIKEETQLLRLAEIDARTLKAERLRQAIARCKALYEKPIDSESAQRELYCCLHEVYDLGGLNSVRLARYTMSRNTLVIKFFKFVPGYERKPLTVSATVAQARQQAKSDKLRAKKLAKLARQKAKLEAELERTAAETRHYRELYSIYTARGFEGVVASGYKLSESWLLKSYAYFRNTGANVAVGFKPSLEFELTTSWSYTT